MFVCFFFFLMSGFYDCVVFFVYVVWCDFFELDCDFFDVLVFG